MSSHPPFSTQVIGQAEKTLNAILQRQLAGTGLTEPQWITLTLTAARCLSRIALRVFSAWPMTCVLNGGWLDTAAPLVADGSASQSLLRKRWRRQH